VLPGRCRTGLRFTGLQQRVEVPTNACRGDAEPIADLARGDGSGLQQELDDRATCVAVTTGCRRRSGSGLRTEFHNTIVTEFPMPVKQGHPYVGNAYLLFWLRCPRASVRS
jgi:hypothetical protein